MTADPGFTAPDHSEPVAGVEEDAPAGHFDYEVGSTSAVCNCSRCATVRVGNAAAVLGAAFDKAVRDAAGADAADPILTPAPRIHWKARALAADAALPAYEILLDGKPIGRCVASNAAEALRWAIRQNPGLKRRVSVRGEA
jgi:hypothetical protein